MSELFAIKLDKSKQHYVISGEMTLESATVALAETKALFDDETHIEIDLKNVTRSDSAGLALLIEWARQAKQKHKTIRFLHIPEQMLAIAKASALEEVLPLN
ncbi:MAG TPA: STAS domain-containing protein [Methylophaga aminisulfidivorans]|uniref:STAS domain-containing protein n=2 Tax=root TaxID=1 RepID=A0A7C1W595_9GAMM|nr:STAS domain-containing protein [Methylophaga aminisulfidivorans]